MSYAYINIFFYTYLLIYVLKFTYIYIYIYMHIYISIFIFPNLIGNMRIAPKELFDTFKNIGGTYKYIH
jgi:hypothetical protein